MYDGYLLIGNKTHKLISKNAELFKRDDFALYSELELWIKGTEKQCFSLQYIVANSSTVLYGISLQWKCVFLTQNITSLSLNSVYPVPICTLVVFRLCMQCRFHHHINLKRLFSVCVELW